MSLSPAAILAARRVPVIPGQLDMFADTDSDDTAPPAAASPEFGSAGAAVGESLHGSPNHTTDPTDPEGIDR